MIKVHASLWIKTNSIAASFDTAQIIGRILSQ